MILSYLYLENFKKYKKKKFIFEQSLTGIIGANGSGKSTIFEAILFALYGSCDSTKENLKNSYASKNDKVVIELEFNISGDVYIINRELRGASLKAEASICKNNISIASGMEAVNASVINLISMNKTIFKNTVFASQKEISSLSSMRADDRKKIIRKLLGLEQIDKIEAVIKSKIKDLKAQLNAFQSIMLSFEQIKNIQKDKDKHTKEHKDIKVKIKEQEKKLKIHQNKLEELKTKTKLFNKTKIKHLEALHSIEITQNNLTSLNKRIKECENEIKKLNEKKSHIDKYKNIEKKLQEAKKSLKEYSNIEIKAKENISLKREIQSLREIYKHTQNKLNQIQEDKILFAKKEDISKKLQKDIETYKKNHIDIEKNVNEIKQDISANEAIRDNYQKQKNKILQLGKKSNCPTCTRALEDEYQNVLDILQENINITQKSIEDLQNKLKSKQENEIELKNKYELLCEEFNENNISLSMLDKSIKSQQDTQKELDVIKGKGILAKQTITKNGDIDYDEKKHNELKSYEEALQAKHKEFLVLSKEISRINDISKEIGDKSKEILNQNKQKDAQEIKIKEINYDKTLHKEIITKEEKVNNEFLHQKDNLASICQEEMNLNHLIKRCQKDIDENEKQKEKQNIIQKDIDDYELIMQKLKGFKVKINSQITPRISFIASRLFSDVTRGKYQRVDVSEDFDFFITDDNRSYPINRFSGGEIDLANLILRISISKALSEMYSNSNICFFAFDEVFSSQDEKRREYIMQVLSSLKDQYPQIFLITHNSNIKEMCESAIEL